MKTRAFSLLLIVAGINFQALAGTGDENSLLFEFKKLVTCEAAKSELSSYKIEVECDSLDRNKKRFFGGHYLGKKPVNAVVSELKKNPRLISITQNAPAYRIQ